MKKVFLLSSVCAASLCCALSTMAESRIVTTINGNPDTRELVKITFDGDYAILNFADNSTETVDMSLVRVTLSHDESTAIKDILNNPDKAPGVYNLNGQHIADTPDGLKKGIYIVNGQKVLVK